ncbi:MAG: NTP transferase domain-containing protein [Euryarchaeota archaeon]|nr:NTP transferase domain-containing protein [Euryarchaeota archaeon]
MDAVVLAAGKGTRMHPFTGTRPKPMVPVANRPLLEHLLHSLRKAGVRRALLVVPRDHRPIRDHFQNNPISGLRLHYRTETRPRGTAHALGVAEGWPHGDFLALNGDILLDPGDIRRLAHAPGEALLISRLQGPVRGGCVVHRAGRVQRIVEKPRTPVSPWVNTGAYRLRESIFPEIARTPLSPRGEYEFTTTLEHLIPRGLRAIEARTWMDVSYPWDLLEANRRLLGDLRRHTGGNMEAGAVLRGPVEVGRGTRVRRGAYIEGPVLIGRDCDIGPNCYIRPHTSIGDGCRVGHAVEVKNSILMEGAHVGHLSYVGDSVLGSGVNFGAGTTVANLRLDMGPIPVTLRGKRIDTGLRKLGALVGDGAHTGIHTLLNVGAIVPPGARLLPGRLYR